MLVNSCSYHSSRPIWAKGLCNTCYKDQWRIDNPDKVAQYNAILVERYSTDEDTRRKRLLANKEWRDRNPDKVKAYNLAWLKDNLDHVKLEKKKANLRGYGLTIDDYQSMVDAQKGRCAICYEPPSAGTSLVVDHDHLSGKVRGLLCIQCNSMLGMAKDNRDILQSAISYLVEMVGEEIG